MADNSDDWELIGDIPDEDGLADRYIPPVAKASRALPPPSIQHYPHTPAGVSGPFPVASIEFFQGGIHTSWVLTFKLQIYKAWFVHISLE